MKTKTIVQTSMAVAINIVGAYIGTVVKFVFLDTIGTFMAAFLFGPVYGMIVGAVTLLVSGTLFDSSAYFFIPVQIILGLLGGYIYKSGFFRDVKPVKIVIGILGITIPASVVAAIIASFVFGGITTSGTSYIVMVLKQAGVSVFNASFISQLPMDLLDKTITILLALTIVKRLKLDNFKR